MWKSVLLLCSALVIQAPAIAAGSLGEPAADVMTRQCGRAPDVVVMLSPTNPNDPLFPPSQWPKCTV